MSGSNFYKYHLAEQSNSKNALRRGPKAGWCVSKRMEAFLGLDFFGTFCIKWYIPPWRGQKVQKPI
jgi:hypothetical protein